MLRVVALAEEAAEDGVLIGDAADLGERLDLADRLGQRERIGRLDGAGDDGVGQRVERVEADGLQHVCDLSVVRADVALDEAVVVLEGAEGSGLGHGDVRSGQEGGTGLAADVRDRFVDARRTATTGQSASRPAGARGRAACRAKTPARPLCPSA
jgi:hypothetical protein